MWGSDCESEIVENEFERNSQRLCNNMGWLRLNQIDESTAILYFNSNFTLPKKIQKHTSSKTI